MNMVIENVRQLRGDVDDSCPIGPDGKRQHTYDYREGGCRQVKDAELSANLGWAMPGTGSAMVMQRRAKEERQMLQGEYLGMRLTIEDVDKENLRILPLLRPGRLPSAEGKESGLLRYPPTTACPWTRDREYEWVSVEGKGAVHSYVEVHHAIQPAFRAHVPYMILLVDLDTQKGEPSEHEALRVVGNLLTADGELAPPDQVAAGRHRDQGERMVWCPVADGLAVPNWTIDEDADQPVPWRYPG